MQLELVFFDGCSQFLKEQQPVPFFVKVVLVDRKRGAANLGPEHRDIRAPQQTRAIGCICGGQCDADARTDALADARAYRIKDERLS